MMLGFPNIIGEGAQLRRIALNNSRCLVAVLVTALLAACGGGDDSSSATTAPAAGSAPQASGTVTVYTGRHYGIEAVFDAFTAQTGIEVRFTTGKDPELRERLVAEGANTPADLFMTADAGNISLAADAGILAPVDSAVLTEAIPGDLRDEQGRWFALSQRARVIIHSTERVTEPPETYAAIGDPQWRGKVCLRPSTHPYTQSLVSSIIAAEGEQAAADIVASWVANDPLYIDSDTDIYNAVAEGECDVAIANTYYFGRLLTESPDFPVAISWPEQSDDQRGAHVNISAAGITANAANPTAALALLEWLVTDGQQQFTDANFEYPAAVGFQPGQLVASWGEFRADVAPIRQFGTLQATAVEILDAAGYE
jgi:iron(III) transport system substrate-binding protein